MSGQSGESVTLAFLEQQAKVINELADQRADLAVLLAMVQRMDGTLHGLLDEVRALHGQIGRFSHRLRELEAKQE
jgi:ABC-type transporter Mla subunit MlaD